jgi:hypothetical protein
MRIQSARVSTSKGLKRRQSPPINEVRVDSIIQQIWLMNLYEKQEEELMGLDWANQRDTVG